MDEGERIFRNTAHWYNNASFVIPLAATIVVGLAGVATRRADLLGFAVFLAAVTVLMVPVVLATWRHTATAIVVTATEIRSMHGERTLKSLRWADVASVGRRETQGNVRWEIATAGGDRLLLDGEIEDLETLVGLARERAEARRVDVAPNDSKP